MFSIKKTIKQNKLNFTIALFIAVFSTIHYLQPGLLYENDGSFRNFGVGYKSKTVVPIWLVSIILAMLCYVFISFYLANS